MKVAELVARQEIYELFLDERDDAADWWVAVFGELPEEWKNQLGPREEEYER